MLWGMVETTTFMRTVASDAVKRMVSPLSKSATDWSIDVGVTRPVAAPESVQSVVTTPARLRAIVTVEPPESVVTKATTSATRKDRLKDGVSMGLTLAALSWEK